ncbi:MAG: hypothetical protein M3173_01120 [Chloroflexota bacterium]|nr:hypothetical protein [Chloroflexota bacterium]
MRNTIARHARMLLLLAAPLLLFAACGGESDDEPTGSNADTDTASPTTSASPTPPRSTASPPPVPDPVQAAVSQAAEDAGVSEDEIELLHYEPREWPSTALGCPEPGQMYAQVITEGYLVHVRADGEVVQYHTDRGTTAVRCDNPSP